MALDFPSSPSNNQTFVSDNVTYTYSETKGVWYSTDATTQALTTDSVDEGSTNLYFTNTRSISALTGGNNIAIDANGLITSTVSVNYSYANTYLLTALSDESTEITTGTKLKFRAPFAMELYQTPRASLNTSSSSGVVEVNIFDDGSSIFSTNLTIDANETTSTTAATSAALSSTSIADDSEITMDIVSAGTGATGLKVTLYYRKS